MSNVSTDKFSLTIANQEIGSWLESTDWAQVLVSALGILIAAGVALQVSERQHRKHVNHETRLGVAASLAEMKAVRKAIHRFDVTALQIQVQDVLFLDKERTTEEEVNRKQYEADASDSYDASIRAIDDLVSRCQILQLIGSRTISQAAEESENLTGNLSSALKNDFIAISTHFMNDIAKLELGSDREEHAKALERSIDALREAAISLDKSKVVHLWDQVRRVFLRLAKK